MTGPRASRSALAAESGVGSGVSLQRVFAKPADQQIIAESPFERVVPRAAVERIFARTTQQPVLAVAPRQLVVAIASIEPIVPHAADVSYS